MKRTSILIFILLMGWLIFPAANVFAQSEPPVVRAVLFYSPTCPHCEFVIKETILPLIAEHGEDRLQIIGIDVTQPQGQELFLSALDAFKQEQGGVPFLVIGDTFLIGSADIPEKFPGMVESYLAADGVDWPDIPGLKEILPPTTEATEAAAPQTDPIPATVSPSSSSPTAVPESLDLPIENDSTWQERFAYDPKGNTLAVIVLAGMLAAVVWAVVLFQSNKTTSPSGRLTWLVPLLSVIGFGVAGYLAYVEVSHVSAVCGPVGDCNTVQQSEYARLFGILPIGVMGLAGYVVIFLSWLVSHYANGRIVDLASLAVFAMTAFGTLFSIYLTFLEPFVIGATCAWCLTSAVLMTVLMLLSVGPAKLALGRVAGK